MMNAVNNIAAALAATGSGKSDGLIKATVARGPSGEGVFTLRLSGGREIGIQVQAEGGGAALEPGQKVLVSPSDGKIFIPAADSAETDQPSQPQQWAQAQQPAQMRQAAQMLLQQVQGGEDLFISGKQQAEAAAAESGAAGSDGAKDAAATGQAGLAKIVGFKVVSEGEGHADGIYRADAAGHILEEPEGGEAPIKDFAAVRLNTVNGQQVVTVLAADGLTAAIEELRSSFESPMLRALPLELLKDIFNERGFLDAETLKALDAAMVNQNLSIDTSSPFQMERIGQWLRIALDNPGMAQELVDRIPALGAKDAAALLELIGRLSSGVEPESFFATGQTLPKLESSIGGADLLQSLVKAAFSAAPNALLNLVKQIDTSSVMLGAQLPQTEAARVIREIKSALPAQTAAKPGSLHDAGQLSPRVLETNATPAQKAPTPASAVPQIRAGYSELTETAVRALLGGNGKADAAAVSEKINTLRDAVARMPVTVAPSDQGRDTATRDSGSSGNKPESNAASANTQSAVSRLSASTNETVVNNTAKAPETFTRINAQLAVHRASSVSSGNINTNAGNGNAKAADAFPAVNRGFAPQQPQQSQPSQQTQQSQPPSVQTGVTVAGSGTSRTSGINAVDNQNIRDNVSINRSIPVDSIRGMSISASNINTNNANPTDNQNIRGDVGVNNRQSVVDNSRGVNNSSGISINTNSNARPIDNSVSMGINAKSINTNDINASDINAKSINVSGMNTNSINPPDNQNIRGDVSVNNRQGVIDNSRSINNSGGTGINTNSNTKPVDNPISMGINVRAINANDISANSINTRGINIGSINPPDNQNIRGDIGIGVNNRQGAVDNSRSAGINTAGATQSVNVPAIKERCLSAVDTLKSSAAPILRELAERGEISAKSAASLIGHVRDAVSSLDESLRPLVRSERPVPPEFYERVAVGAGHKISAEAKNALFLQIGSAQALIRRAVETAEGVKTGVNVNANIKPNTAPNVNSSVNTNIGANINSNIRTIASVNPGINPSINSGVSTNVNSVTNPSINSGVNQGANPTINQRVNSVISPNINPSINSGVHQVINPSINTHPTAAANPNVNNRANANTAVSPSVNTNINTVINPIGNPVINTNVNPNINSNVNSGINTNANIGANSNINTNANVNRNIDPGANSNINTAVNANSNPSPIINNNVNQNVNPPVSPNVGTNVNSTDTNTNINPNANINTAQNGTDSRPDGFLQIARRIWANTEKLRAGFKEAFSTLDLQNRASPLDKPADGSTAGVVRRSADSLRTEMLLDVSRALRDVFSSVDELNEIVSQLSSGSQTLPEAETALLRAVRALEHQARQSGAEVMERLKDILRELNRLQAEAARAQEQGAAANAAMRSSPTDAIRSAALTAARSLENLQLLSTQTRAAETEQHLLAIPAKIGGEWTEVQIKFVKERKGEKGENKDGHVSIYLNVAPSALGQVSAHLDYHPPNLKLAFQFEKPEVTRWFRQQSNELREALSQAGLPGAVLEFHNRRHVRSEPAVPARQPASIDSAGVDEADGFEIKNGRVDFKI